VKKGSNKPVRCAIYTRASTEHGLEQDFNSLDAQYDAAQAYIRSQAHAGWTLIRSRYADGGYSGGSTERPALQRLLADVTLLTREWEGELQRVMVLADGFSWNGKTYPSLSRVAFAITGSRWNGPRFFGLRDKPASEARP
jgi:hypothetical protein